MPITTELEQLEAQLREEHEKNWKTSYFMDVVNVIRMNTQHRLHDVAVKYNKLVYDLQNPKRK